MTIIVVLLFAAIAIAACALYWWSARRRALRAQEPPLLVFPVTASPAHTHVNGNGKNGVNGNGARRLDEREIVRPFAIEPPHVNHGNNGNHGHHVNPVNHANHRRPVRPRYAERGDDRDSGEYAATQSDNAETVRFLRPTDPAAAVQLLPGRLEVLEGATPHREIRFMRVPGEPAHVILGREVRLTPHYIGLGSPTVSRRHARLDFADNQWIVKNLSRTNPLVVNDEALFDTDAARPLADGDRLELGDVVLRFHAH